MGKNFSNFTYGVGLEITASSFKQVKDDLKLNLDSLSKMVKSYGKVLKIDPNADLSKLFDEMKKIQSIVDGIDGSDNSFGDFVDKGMLSRISDLESGLNSISTNTDKLSGDFLELKSTVDALTSSLKSAGKIKFPATFDNLFGDAEDQRDNIQKTKNQISEISKLMNNLETVYSTIFKQSAGEKLDNNEIFDLMSQFDDLKLKLSDLSDLTSDEINETLNELETIGSKFNGAIKNLNADQLKSFNINDDFVVQEINDLIHTLEEKQKELTEALGRFETEQEKFLNKNKIQTKSLGTAKNEDGSNYTLRAKIIPDTNEAEWVNKINDTIKNVEPKLTPVNLTPTFLNKSKNVKQEVVGDLAKIDHTVNVNLEVKDNLEKFNEQIQNIETSIKNAKERLANEGSFKIRFEYEEGGRFRDVAYKIINQFKRIDTKFYIANGTKFIQDVTGLRDKAKKELSKISIDFEPIDQDKILSQVDTLRSSIEEKLSNISIGLSSDAMSQLFLQMVSSQDTGKNNNIETVTHNTVASNAINIDSKNSSIQHTTQEVAQLSDKAKNAQAEIEKINSTIKSLEKIKFNAPEFLKLGDFDKKLKPISGSKEKLKGMVQEFNELSELIQADENQGGVYDNFDDYTNACNRAKELYQELEAVSQRQIQYCQQRLAENQKILESEKQIVAVKKEQANADSKSSKKTSDTSQQSIIDISALKKRKTLLEKQIKDSNKIFAGVNKNQFQSANFTHFGEWDDKTNSFKRNEAEIKQLVNRYNELREARKQSGTVPTDEEKNLRQRLNTILESQKQHVKEIVSELEKELSVVTEVVGKYNDINKNIKKENKKDVSQIYNESIDEYANRQKLAQETLSMLKKSQLAENRWNFRSLVSSKLGDVNGVLGTGSKSDLQSTVDFYYKLIDAQKALEESGQAGTEEYQNNLQYITELKGQLKQVWQDQVKYCQEKIKGYDIEKQKAQETLDVIKKISEEEVKNVKANKTAPKTNGENSTPSINVNQQLSMSADEANKKIRSLNTTIAHQRKQLLDLENSKTWKNSSAFVKLGQWDAETKSFKKNSGYIQGLIAKYNELRDARLKAGGAGTKVTGEEASIRGKLSSIYTQQKKHLSEVIANNEKELATAKQIVEQYKQASDYKSKSVKANSGAEASTKSLDDLVARLNKAKEAQALLKSTGWDALTKTGLGDMKNRLKDSSYDLEKLLQMYNNLVNKKKELEKSGDTKSAKYTDIVNSLNDTKQKLGTIYQDQTKYTQTAIANLEAEISKEKELLQVQTQQTKEAEKQAKESAKKTEEVNKQSASVNTSSSSKTLTSESNSTLVTNGASATVQLDGTTLSSLAKDETLKSIDGKVNSILSKLGSDIKITGSNISIDASNVSVSGKNSKDTSSTSGTTNNQSEKKGIKDTVISSQIRQLTEFEERAKRSEIYSDKLKNKFKSLRDELNKASSQDNVDAYKVNLDKFKEEFAQLKTFKGLYDNLVKSKSKQLQLVHQIDKSSSSTQDAKRELQIEQEKSKKIEEHLSKYTQLYTQHVKELAITKAIQQANQEIEKKESVQVDSAINKQNNELIKVVDDAQKKLNSMQDGMKNFKIPMTDSAITKVKEYEQLLTTLKTKQQEIQKNPSLLNDEDYKKNFDSLLRQMQDVEKQFTTLRKSSENFFSKIKSEKDIKVLGKTFNPNDLEQMHDAMQEFANQSGVGAAKLVEFNDAGRSATFEIKNGRGQVQQLTVAYDAATNSLGRFATTTKTSLSESQKFFNSLKHSFQNVARYIMSFGSVYRIFAMLKQGVGYVKEIDSALTELKKVTDETEASYDNFLQNMSKTAGVVGSTVSELTTMAAEWARLGYSMEESGKLAESTAILLNVSEFEDATKASEALISTMQAFQYTADESQHVVDILNEVGNNYAVSSDGIATALQDSASALMEGGNNLEQATALVAAANKVVQDPNSVGSALRTISLRLRGTSVKVLEEMGEETDGVIESVSKLQSKIQALSGVNILTESGDYKDTYTILKEIGQVWEDMSDIDQAALLELMAGKNRANTLSAILGNMEDLEGAYETALNAEGSALRENEAWLDSIQGRIDLFNNSLQTMWMNTLDSEWVKGFVDFGRLIIELVDKVGIFKTAIAGLLTYMSASSKINFDLASMLGIHNLDNNFLKGFSAFGKQGLTGAIASLFKSNKKTPNIVENILGKPSEVKATVGDFVSAIQDNINGYVTIDTTKIDSAIDSVQQKLAVARQQLDGAKLRDWNYYKSLGSTTPAKDRDNSIVEKTQEIENLEAKLSDLQIKRDEIISSATNNIATSMVDSINKETQAYESMFTVLSEIDGKKLYLGDEQDAAAKIDNISQAAKNGQTSLANYVSSLSDTDIALKAYVASVDDGNYSLAGFQQFIAKHNAGIQASGIAAKAAAVGHQLLNAALSMGVTLIASFAINALVNGLDSLITTSKEAAESAREAIDSYQETQNTLKNQKKTVDELSKSYAKLSTGVNHLTNENVGLTAESYGEYLEVCNDIADIFPELIAGYDSEGNAILTLKGKVDLLTEAYENKTKAAAAQFLTPENQENIWRTYDDTVNKNDWSWSDSKRKASLAQEQKMLQALSKLSYEELQELQDIYDEYANGNPTGIAEYLNSKGFDFGTISPQDAGSKFELLADEYGFSFDNIVEEIELGEGKVEKSTNAFKDSISVALSNVNSEVSTAMSDIKQTVSAKLLWNTDYQKLSEESKEVIDTIVNNLNPDMISQMGATSIDDVVTTLMSDLKGADKDIISEINNIQGNIAKAIADGDETAFNEAKAKFDNLIPDSWRDGATNEIVIDENADAVTQFLQKTVKDIENQSKNYEAQLKFKYDYDNNYTIDKALTDRIGEIGEDARKEIQNAIDGLNIGKNATIKDILDKISKDLVGADDADGKLSSDQLTKMYENWLTKGSPSTMDNWSESQMSAIQALDAVIKTYGFDIDTVKEKLISLGYILPSLKDVGSFNLSSESTNEMIDSFQDNINSIKDAWNSLNSGEMTKSDFIDLVQEFPQLMDGVNLADDNWMVKAKENLEELNKTRIEEFISKLDKIKQAMAAEGQDTSVVDSFINYATQIQSMPLLDVELSVSPDTISGLTSAFESYNATMEQSNEIIYDGQQVSSDYYESLKEYIDDVEELDSCFDKNNKSIVTNSQKLKTLIAQQRKEASSTASIARAQAQLKYTNLLNQLKNLTSGTKTLNSAQVNQVNSLIQQINSVKTAVNNYKLLELAMSGATDALLEYQKAQSSESETDFEPTMLGMIESVMSGFDTGDIGSDTFLAAVRGLFDETVYGTLSTAKDLDSVWAEMTSGNMSKFFTYSDEQFSITRSNLENFVDAAQEAGVMWGDTFDEFGIESGVTLETFAKKLGLSEDAVMAFLDILSDQTIGGEKLWGDLADFEGAEKIDELTDKYSTLLQRRAELQKSGKYNGELEQEIQQAQQELQTQTDATINKVKEYTVAAQMLNATNVNSGITYTNEQLQEIQTNFNKTFGTNYECKIENGKLVVTDQQLGQIQEKKDKLREPTQWEIQFSYQTVLSQIDELKTKKEQLSEETKVSLGYKTTDNVEQISSDLDSKISALESQARAIELQYGLKPDDTTDSILEKFETLESDGVQTVLTVDVTQANKDVDDTRTKAETPMETTLTINTETGTTAPTSDTPSDTTVNFKVGTGYQEVVEKIAYIKAQTAIPATQVVTINDNGTAQSVATDVDNLNNKVINEKSFNVTDNSTTAEKTLEVESLDNTNISDKSFSVYMNGFGTVDSQLSSIMSDLSSIDGMSATATVTVNTTSTGGASAMGNVKHAYANGAGGLPRADKNALVGELGPETVVDPIAGVYYTVGENGAEFVDLPKGAIIFNHKQTEQLLANGHISSRGRMVNGTAFANGNAYAQTYGNHVGYFESYGGSGDSDSSSSSSDYSDSYDDATDSAEEFEEVLDWIEILLEEINEQIDLMSAKVENTVNLTKKNNLIDDIIDINKTKLSKIQAGFKKYSSYAAKLLAEVPVSYRKAAQDGAIAIEEFVGEADEKTVEAIRNYREWAQKVADLKQQLEETKTEIADLAKQQFDNISDRFGQKISIFDRTIEQFEGLNDTAEAMGLPAAEAFYKQMITYSKKRQDALVEEQWRLQDVLDRQVKLGNIQVYDDRWYEMVEELYEVDIAIQECVVDMEEYQNAINDIYWDNFDELISRLEGVSEEAQNLIDLMDSADMVVTPESDNGWSADQVEWTKEGIASLGLYAQQMETSEYTAKQYEQAINDLNKDYKKGLYSESEYIEKLNELKDAQYDSIEAYYDAQDAIVDLNKTRVESIKKGIEKEIDAYKELIEKKKEALENEKDLYDFQKSVGEQSKNIAEIERKLAALAGDNSVSAAAKRKKLEAELAEAQYELQDTYYNRSVEDKQTALDKELENFQEEKDAEIEKWEEYLEKIETVVADSLLLVQNNAAGVYDTLNEKANEYGLTLSDTVLAPWKDGALAIDEYQDKFGKSVSSTMEQLAALKKAWQDVISEITKEAKITVTNVKESNANITAAKKQTATKTTTTTNKSTSSSSSNKNTSSASKPSLTTGTYVEVKSGTKWYADSYGGGSWGYARSGKIQYINTSGSHAYNIEGLGWVRKQDIVGYASGTKSLKKSGIVNVDELGEELIIGAQNGRLTYLEKGSGVVPADITSNLMSWGKLDPQEILDRNRPAVAPHKNVFNNTEIKLDASVGTLVNIENFDGNDPDEIVKIVNKAYDKKMQELNNSIKRFSR